MEPIVNLEEKILQDLVDAGADVRIITTNGYQTKATVIDFDSEVIIAQVDGERWMVYRHAVSTIVFD